MEQPTFPTIPARSIRTLSGDNAIAIAGYVLTPDDHHSNDIADLRRTFPSRSAETIQPFGFQYEMMPGTANSSHPGQPQHLGE
jgi:hypothetical protein